MAQPLSPRSPNAMKITTPAISRQNMFKSPPPPSSLRQEMDDKSSIAHTSASSPFETDVGTDVGQENRPPKHQDRSPTKRRSPSKPTNHPNSDIYTLDEQSGTNLPLPPFVISPKGRASLKSSSSSLSPSKVPLPPSSPEKPSPSVLGGRHPISDPESALDRDHEESEFETRSVASDDTCFSTFSAVPNVDMTNFFKLGNRPQQSPARSPKRSREPFEPPTPSTNVFATPATSRRHHDEMPSRNVSPTPRPNKQTNHREGNTTNLLLDFTQQLDGCQQGKHSPTKSTTEPNLLAHINNQRMPSPAKGAPRTPGGRKNLLNLLDFDLPPEPTPRSVPSITVRELESLKSSYQSEISSLKASLSGREAEVCSLKKAIGDAERRVGEALESVREERSAREHAESGKAEWEKKGKEVESVLKSVKEEFIAGEKEREDLLQRLEESNRARDEAEMRAAEATTKASVAQGDFDGKSSNPSATDALIAAKVAQQLDEKMESLARELHSVYKKKHESKVATLKKTYDARGERRSRELQHKIEELTKHNEELLAVKESSLSLELPANRRSETKPSTPDQYKAELQEQKAKIAGLVEEMSSVRNAHAVLTRDLESERVEKGELVAAVDEMLALQSEVGAPSAVEDFRKSIGRPSGLKAPGSVESKIGRVPPPISRSISGGKSRMMSNIERMGGRKFQAE